MFKNQKILYAVVGILIILGFSARLIPHAANIAPIGAIALFGGLYLPKRYAIVAPLFAMLLSDLVIGFYSPAIMATVYASFVIASLTGLWVREHKSFATVVGGTLLGSVLFFLTTNAAVWAFGTMYSHTADGLLQSYTMALPFFRNSLIGDMIYTGLLIGGMEFFVLKEKYLWKHSTSI